MDAVLCRSQLRIIHSHNALGTPAKENPSERKITSCDKTAVQVCGENSFVYLCVNVEFGNVSSADPAGTGAYKPSPYFTLQLRFRKKKVVVNQKGINKNHILVRNRRLRNRTQPAKGRKTENESAQIKKWCKFARGIKQKGRKMSGRKTWVGG
jgi:hypothetical protein